ncbi:MAG: hypothetical protein FWH10_00360 [Oscillospiraceae bacterium]|nr:hypothetical protein [Oscillospiraceae bacterium]
MGKLNNKSFREIIGGNNILTKTISIAFLFLIMFGLFAFIITGLYRFGLFEFPQFIKNIFFTSDGGETPLGGDGLNFYDILRPGDSSQTGGENNGDEGFVLEITLDNIREVISQTRLPDNLHLETVARYYINGVITRTEEMLLWKKDKKYKYTLAVNDIIQESYINNSETELIENFNTGGRLRKSSPEAFSFDNIPHIANINYYLDLLERLESSELANVWSRQDRDANIVEIKYIIPGSEQSELIEISLDTGIAMRARSYAGEHYDLYYESVTSVIEAYYDGDILPDTSGGILIRDSLFDIR